MGRHLSGHWTNRSTELHQGLLQLSPDQTVAEKASIIFG